jgi:hypothetical protein
MSAGAFDPETLLREHRLYDQYVDVVSAFEWIFTEVDELSSTVAHFERFPKLDAADGNAATPDFTVAFTDGTGLVGEIARIALPEQSVDGLCSQIERYDSLPYLPLSDGGLAKMKSVDVVLLVPLELGTDAVRRILRDRFYSLDHPYNPGHPPCIIQYVAQSDKYVFQRRPDAGNGELRESDRSTGIGSWLAIGDFKPPAAGFAHVKAQSPFMNDPVAPLYLASQLWTKVFPVLVAEVGAVGDYQPWVGETVEIVTAVREMYGRVSTGAVRRAMEVLVASRSAERLGDDRWRVAWGDLASRPGEDLAELLAHRAVKPPSKGPIKRLEEWYSDHSLNDPVKTPPPSPGKLF